MEPGVTNLAVSKAAAPYGLFYAPDPSSQVVCSVGGNVAENSGGAHCLKHGFTVHHVTGLQVVTPRGELTWLGDGTGASGGYDLVGVSAVGGQEIPHYPVVGERLQRVVRHGVDGERGGQRVHVQHVRGRGVLDRGRGPQQPLRPGPLVGQPQPAGRVQQRPVRPVGLPGHGDAQAVAQFTGHPAGHRGVPAGHEQRGDRGHGRIAAGLDPALHAPQVGLGRGLVLPGREQQGHVHRDRGADALLGGRVTHVEVMPGDGAG